MKSKKYKFKFFTLLLLILTAHIALFSSGIFHIPLKGMFYVDSFLFLLFFLGTLIISPGLDKAPDNFVNRFLILTTFQLIMSMFAILALVVMHISHVKTLGYNLLSVFLCLMISQSIFLVKFIKK